jgi:hypothetical protein
VSVSLGTDGMHCGTDAHSQLPQKHSMAELPPRAAGSVSENKSERQC